MAQPTAYNQTTDFSEYQINNPDAPFNGSNHDTEFGNVETTLAELRANLALIQRDDGKLLNQSVHPDAFDANSRALMATTASSFQGAWVTATAYTVGQCVSNSSIIYICVVAHTSGVFADDLAAVEWLALTPAITAFVQTLMDDTTANAFLTTLTATRAETGAVAVTALNKFRERISVKDFGATGDGVTVDTTALTNAIAAAKTLKALLEFPAGTYLTGQLALTSDHYFIGLGEVNIKAVDGLNQDIFLGSSVSNIYMENLILNGNKPTTTSRVGTYGQGLHLLKGSNVILINVRGTQCLENAFRIVGINGFYFEKLEADNCAHNGIYLSGHTDGTALQNGTLVAPYAHDNAADGIGIELKSRDITISSPRCENNGNDHTLYSGGEGIIVTGADTTQYPKDILITDPATAGNYAGGIYVHGSAGVTISNPRSIGDGVDALVAETTFGNGISVYNLNTSQQQLRDITIVSPVIEGSGKNGIYIDASGSSNTLGVQIHGGGLIRNPGQKQANTYDGINAQNVTDLSIGPITIYDDQGTKTMRYAANIASTCTDPRIMLPSLRTGATGVLNSNSSTAQYLFVDPTNGRILSCYGTGIGSPTAALDLARSGTGNQDLKIRNANVTLLGFVDSGAAYVGTSTNHPLLFKINNTTVGRFDTSGNFILGTDTDIVMDSNRLFQTRSYTVAALPAGTAGKCAFASNGRKNGEGVGAGTGVLVFHDGTNWCACDTGVAVAA
jgi:hypothetical protein